MEKIYYLFENGKDKEPELIGKYISKQDFSTEKIVEKVKSLILENSKNPHDFYLKKFEVTDAYVMKKCRKIELA